MSLFLGGNGGGRPSDIRRCSNPPPPLPYWLLGEIDRSSSAPRPRPLFPRSKLCDDASEDSHTLSYCDLLRLHLDSFLGRTGTKGSELPTTAAAEDSRRLLDDGSLDPRDEVDGRVLDSSSSQKQESRLNSKGELT